MKGRKKHDLQRLIYCQANTTWTGIYHQGHSQVRTAIATGKQELMCRSSPEPTICLNQVTTVVISRAGTNLLSLSSAGSFMGNLSSFTPGSQRFARSLHRHPAINRANIFIKTLDVKASRKLRNTLPKYEKGGGEEMKTIHRKTSKDGYLKKNNTDRTRKKYGDLKKQSSSQ